MRHFVNIIPTIWTGESGRQLRGDGNAWTIAFYLMTCPSSTVAGLYYVPVTTIMEETGLNFDEVTKALTKVRAAGIAEYDLQMGMVWVPEHLNYQVGEQMTQYDKRRGGINREIALHKKHPFYQKFMSKYGESHALSPRPKPAPALPPAKKTLTLPPAGGLTSGTFLDPSSAIPTDPHGAPFPDLDLVCSDPDPGSDPEPPDRSGPTLQEQASLWVRHPSEATNVYPQPHLWPEVVGRFEKLCKIFGHKFVEQPRHAGVPSVQALLGRYSEGFTPEQLDEAILGASLTDHYQQNPQYQGLQVILKDQDRVQGFIRTAQAGGPRGKAPQPNHGFSAVRKFGKKT
jgi:hypothetical protein